MMLAYLSVAIECSEGLCSETWPRIILALTTVRSLRKVCSVLFLDCMTTLCVTDLAAS